MAVERRREKLTSTPRRRESDEHMLVTSDGLLERRIRQHLDLAGRLLGTPGPDARLLRDEGREALQVAAAVVVLGVLALAIEPLEGREALDAILLAQIAVLVRVEPGDGELVLGEGEGLRELLVDGGEVAAVAAPGGVEFDERGLAGLEDDLVEVLGDQVDDRGASVDHAAEQSQAAHEQEAQASHLGQVAVR